MRGSNLAVLVVAVASVPAYAHTDLTPSQVQALLDAGGNIVVLDVREVSEFCDSTVTPPGHILGAVNMPWASGYLPDHYGELSPEDSTIVVCRSGSRSNAAANFLDSVGFGNVFDMLGGMSAWQGETEICATSAIPGSGGMTASGLSLGRASPNPARVRTEIPFTIPSGQEPARVTLRIYDSGGRLLATVVDGDRGSGSYRAIWDGTDGRGRPITSGVCFYRLSWKGQTLARAMVRLR